MPIARYSQKKAVFFCKYRHFIFTPFPVISFPTFADTLRPIELDHSPAEVAFLLHREPGFVFLDTSGNQGKSAPDAVSIIACRPIDLVECDIDDLARLSHDFPAPALGMITYEGRATFGIFPDLLVYDHASHQWFTCGAIDQLLITADQPLTTSGDDFEIADFQPSSSQADFEGMVSAALEYIAAGDIYQVNLAQKFTAECHGPPSLFPLYQTLRTASPAPMAAYLSLGQRELLSSSPETFLDMVGLRISTCPIKGTRPRHPLSVADDLAITELLTSEKERAELIMITDLLRNDIGQVCEYGSVAVDALLQLETYEQVHHLVSTVSGQLRSDVSHASALAACYPGGSISGAPKKRACEIIQELEPVPRGLYTGAVGYLGLAGRSQFNITIRSLVREAGQLHYHVGAGIVADSQPTAEFEETLQKAQGLRLAIENFTASS